MKILVSCCVALIAGLSFYIYDLRGELAVAKSQAHSTSQEFDRQGLPQGAILQTNFEQPAAEPVSANDSKTAHAAETPAPATQKQEPGLLAGLGKIFEIPEMKSTMRRQALTETRKKFSDLLKTWQLSKSDEQLFVEMATDLESNGMEAVLGLLTGKADAEETIKKTETAEEETKKRLKALLGEARYADWEQAQEAQSAHDANAGFKEFMSTAGLELPEAEEKQLLSLVADERRAAGVNADDKDVANISEMLSEQSIAAELKKTEAYQNKVLQKAVTFLNPDQINTLQAAFTEENANLKMGIELVRSFLPASNGKPTAPAPAKGK